MALVVKKWLVNHNPAPEEPLFYVRGRDGGFFSWLLTLVGIEATTDFRITPKHLLYCRKSMRGFIEKSVPLSKVNASYFGYHKPWLSSIIFGSIMGVIAFIGLAVYEAEFARSSSFGPIARDPEIAGAYAGAFGLLMAMIRFALKKELLLGFQDGKSDTFVIFKRSVIEGKKIEESTAREAADLIQAWVNVADKNSSPMIYDKG